MGIIIDPPFSIPPMRSDGANPVHFRVSSARERSVSFSIELPFKGFNSNSESGLPVLGVSYFRNEDSSEGEARHGAGTGTAGTRQLVYLDDQVRNVAFWVACRWSKATLWCDHVPLRRREEGCEDGIPWAIPVILGGRWESSVVLEYRTGNRVEGHLRCQIAVGLSRGHCHGAPGLFTCITFHVTQRKFTPIPFLSCLFDVAWLENGVEVH